MLEVFVIDDQAESRLALVDALYALLQGHDENLSLIPKVSFVPLAIDELQHHNNPDLCIIGSNLLERDLVLVNSVREHTGECPLIAWLTPVLESVDTIEHLARLGIDDTFAHDISPLQFIKKIILLSKKKVKPKHGCLVLVDGGKGGVGVTSVTAGLGEALLETGKKVLLVDFDIESQDLSRFLRVRPLVNEALDQLFEGTRPLHREFLKHTFHQVWSDEDNLACLPPLPESEGLWRASDRYARSIYSIVESLEEIFELIVVDAGGLRGPLHNALLRLADKCVFVVNDDPACFIGSVERLRKSRYYLSPQAQLTVLHNGARDKHLRHGALKAQLLTSAKLSREAWAENHIPYGARSSRWPGSGQTPFTLGTRKQRRAFLKLAEQLELIVPQQRSSTPQKLSSLMSEYLGSRDTSTTLPLLDSADQVRSLPELPNPLALLPGPNIPVEPKNQDIRHLITGLRVQS